jgi:hypothetical protein
VGFASKYLEKSLRIPEIYTKPTKSYKQQQQKLMKQTAKIHLLGPTKSTHHKHLTKSKHRIPAKSQLWANQEQIPQKPYKNPDISYKTIPKNGNIRRTSGPVKP